MQAQSKNIMIFRLGSLGDTIISLPVFNRIKELFPLNRIILLTNKPVVSKAAAIELVLGNDSFHDELINYPINTRNPITLIKLAINIRSKSIDTLFYLTQGRTKSALKRDLFFFKIAGVKKVLAAPNLIEDFKLMIDVKTNEYEWEAQRLARRLGYPNSFDFNEDKYWDLHFNEKEKINGLKHLENINSDNLKICFSPGTKMQSKDWGISNWKKLIKEIEKKFPSSNLILIGSEDEKKDGYEILENVSNISVNLCGKTMPRESAIIIGQADIFIGLDSGPMHLAGAVGTPCVAIFSSRNLKRQWFPRGERNQILYHDVDCAGCNLEVCIIQNKKCILSITVEEVLAAVDRILDIKN